MGSAQRKHKDSDAKLAAVAEKMGPYPAPALHLAALTAPPLLNFSDASGELRLVPPTLTEATRRLQDAILDALAKHPLPCLLLKPKQPTAGPLIISYDPVYHTWLLQGLLTQTALQQAYLVLTGVAPSRQLLQVVPWMSVPEYAEQASLIGQPISAPLDALLLPQMVGNVLLQGGNVQVGDCSDVLPELQQQKDKDNL